MRETDKRMAEALGDKREQYLSLSNKKDKPCAIFAENSQFYNQVMEDGYIFNPYIHRRWLPSQYLRWVNIYDGIWEKIKTNYKIWYQGKDLITYTIDEVYKLAMLQRVSPDAYKERKQFFTIEIVKDILEEYIQYCIDTTPKLQNNSYFSCHHRVLGFCSKYLSKVKKLSERSGRIIEENMFGYAPLITKLQQALTKVEEADTYFEIKKVLDDFPELTRPQKYVDTDQFDEPFLKAGAYYTIKDAIMFRHKTLVIGGQKLNGVKAFEKLRDILDNGATAEELHTILCAME